MERRNDFSPVEPVDQQPASTAGVQLPIAGLNNGNFSGESGRRELYPMPNPDAHTYFPGLPIVAAAEVISPNTEKTGEQQ